MATTTLTKEQLELKIELLRAKYREARAKLDTFSMKRFEWEGKQYKRLLLTAVSGNVDESAPIPQDKVYDVAKMIFG
jgi:hypothetical protein